MASKWIAPTADDVANYMSSVVTARAAQTADQIGNILAAVVQRVRGTIEAAGMTPLSSGSGEVPPEAVQHTLVLTTVTLLNATPNFGFLMKGADGSQSGFSYSVQQAEHWIDAVAAGRRVSYPKDINEDTPRELVRYGSESLEADMTTT